MRDVLRATKEIEVPEPSPLFWDQLSHRVAEGVRREPVPSRGWWLSPTWSALASLSAAIVVLVTISLWVWRPGAARPAAPSAIRSGPEFAQDVLPVAAPGDDEAWQVVASLTEGIDVDTVDATGIAPAPGSIEEAATELSAVERAELIRILRVETAESGTEG